MKLRLSIFAVAAAMLTACSSDDPAPLTTQGPLFNPPQAAVVQVIHAVPDAPPVNVTLGTAGTVSGIDFKGSIGAIGIEPATLAVSVDAIDADGVIEDVIAANVPFAADTITTIVAVGSTATIQPIVFSQPLSGVTAGNARVAVLHGAEGAGVVDVFVSDSGVAPVAGDLLGSFDFLGDLGPVEVPAGDYLITVTDGGPGGTVLYDAEVTLADGLDAVLVATPTVAGGSTAAISLVGHARNSASSVEFTDDDDPAFIRVVHLSPDAPAVDVHVNADPTPFVAGLAFADPFATPIVEVEPDTYVIEVSPAGGYPGTVVIPEAGGDDLELTLAAGTTTNVLAVGVLAEIEAITATDDPRSVSTYAKVRLIHASPTAGDVDVYVTAPGVTDLSGETPVATDVAFKDNSGFVPLDNVADPGADDYDITVTAAGSTTAAIGPIPLEIADGDVITIIARDEVGGGAVSADVVILEN